MKNTSTFAERRNTINTSPTARHFPEKNKLRFIQSAVNPKGNLGRGHRLSTCACIACHLQHSQELYTWPRNTSLAPKTIPGTSYRVPHRALTNKIIGEGYVEASCPRHCSHRARGETQSLAMIHSMPTSRPAHDSFTLQNVGQEEGGRGTCVRQPRTEATTSFTCTRGIFTQVAGKDAHRENKEQQQSTPNRQKLKLLLATQH